MHRPLILQRMDADKKTMSDFKPPSRSGTVRDFIIIGIVVLIACGIVLADPDNVFVWLAWHEAVKVDESLVAVVIIGTGFALFSWRRWTELGHQVSEYKRLQSHLSEVNQAASLLSETDDLLQSCLSVEEACHVVIRHIKLRLPDTSGAICIIREERDLVEATARWGNPALSGETFALQDCWALRRGKTNRMLANDSDMRCAHIGPETPHYATCMPMMAQGETLGILYLDSGKVIATVMEPLSDSQEAMVKTLAEHLALAVASLKLRETLRMQSIRDPLTGLFNRRYMEESLERESRRASRRESSLAVMMVDVDHFKNFNDSYGHEAGDELLRALANVFRANLRAEDIACRYGGEEFALILPDATLDAARSRALELKAMAGNLQVEHGGHRLPHVSISIGLACYPQHASAANELVQLADKALYQAKEQGRDRVVTASSSVPA